MATSVDQGNVSASATDSDALLDRAVPLSEAQLLAQATEPAAKADPVPVDAGSGQPIQAAQPNAASQAQAAPAEYAADASNVVHLPANISVDNIKVDGKNLILEQADGTEIVVKDAASNVPTFMLGDVELPRVALIAALEAGGVDVAFGPDGSISVGPGSANSSGGNFETRWASAMASTSRPCCRRRRCSSHNMKTANSTPVSGRGIPIRPSMSAADSLSTRKRLRMDPIPAAMPSRQRAHSPSIPGTTLAAWSSMASTSPTVARL
ncbi:hypothetical protein SLT36_29650 (plasmid) [Aminobacter sp. BA135]|uniref:hypothetical protein n=1 Tax=Aminobacter sp. BA135 TaxID=537596 RepID=UPI003D7B6ACD